MIVLDASAVIAIFKKEPEKAVFQQCVELAEGLCMSAMTYLEICMVLATSDAEFQTLDHFLVKSNVEIVPFDETQALVARQAFLRFGKGRHAAGLNFGDCAAYALAKTRGMPMLFKGEDFAKTDVRPASI